MALVKRDFITVSLFYFWQRIQNNTSYIKHDSIGKVLFDLENSALRV